MKILAVDTSSLVAAVAVMDGDRLLGEYSVNHKKTHSQKLMPMISRLMQDLELKPDDIDIFAAVTGPGSFTGLRIGVTTVKAMAYAAGKRVIGVPSLDALAWNLPGAKGRICPIMDARNNQVYTALYSWDNGQPSRMTDYMGIHIDELADIVARTAEHTVFVGDAVTIHRERLMAALGGSCSFAPASLLHQRGAAVAQAAYVMAEKGITQDSFELVPFYLRKSQAEREYEAAQGRILYKSDCQCCGKD